MRNLILAHPLIDQPVGWYYALIALYSLALLFVVTAAAVLVLGGVTRAVGAWARGLFREES